MHHVILSGAKDLGRGDPSSSSRLRMTGVIAATIAVAVTRLLAISRTAWEWDEMLFASAVGEYDVMGHAPHPPGFPLFVAAAKVVGLLGVSDFRALQTVVVLSAMALFPLTFLLARELGFDFGTALGGALVFVFAPNVWFHGGTAFSDVPALAVLLAACVLLLRDRWIAGAVLLGFAIGIRPQSILVGIVPLVLAAGRLRARTPALLGVVVLVAAISYLGAGLASGSVEDFVESVRGQQEYITTVDSFRNAGRPSLLSLTRTFFKPIRGAGLFEKLVSVLAFIGGGLALSRRFRGGLLLALMFVPLNIFSWLMLDVNASARYGVSYAPMYAILAVYAIPPRPALRATVVALIVTAFVWRAWPALREVRTRPSPPVAAMEWIMAHVRPGARIYAHSSLDPFTRYYLARYDVVHTTSRHRPADSDAYFVSDQASDTPSAVNFIRPWKRLRHIARGRYYQVSISR